MRQAMDVVGMLICRVFHTRILDGGGSSYECRSCFRRYAKAWATSVEPGSVEVEFEREQMNHKQIAIPNTKIVELNHYPAEKEPSHVLVLHAPLTMALADDLNCRDLAFDIQDRPRKFEGTIHLGHEVIDSEIKFESFMGGMETLRPKKVTKFGIVHDASDALGLRFRVHISGESEHAVLDDLLRTKNKDPFDFFIVSLQGEMFGGAPETDAGGTRVEMKTGEVQAEPEAEEIPEDFCVSCENGTALTPAGDFHINGVRCHAPQKNAAAALASAAQMEPRKRGRPRKQRDPEAERAAQIEQARATGEFTEDFVDEEFAEQVQ